MEKLTYKLPDFEGPLDLLLYLISKNKLNILEIRISDLLDQYMEQIERMQRENMEVASEFLEMAARLVHIKSVSLLPKHEEADELERALASDLIAYEEMKRSAKEFASRISFDRFVRAQLTIEFDPTYRLPIAPAEIYSAYLTALGKSKKLPDHPKEESFEEILSRRESYVSVTAKIVRILRRLWGGVKIRYQSLFRAEKSRSGMIATFLALLELIHGKRVAVEQERGETVLRIINGGERHARQDEKRG